MRNDIVELLPHNEMLYNDICRYIDVGEKSIFYSEATGLGKSYIFMRLVETYFKGKRVLYIVPKVAVWNNLISYNEFSLVCNNVHMRTSASFNKYSSDDKLYDDYDVVFVDECHHMLSDVQGLNVAEFLEDMVKRGNNTFGMTATPYYKGTYVDEIWFNVSCYGYDVFEAIDNGILPKIKLALASIDLDSVPADLKAQFSITGTKPLLNRLLDEHKDVQKWLAYFSDIKTLEQNVHEMSALFPDYEILKIYDGMDNETEVFERFGSSDKRTVLMSVNKLLEGVHLDGVEGVLLYRNVVEFSTWMQMYGRLCNIKAKTTPVFLDVTNAIISISKVSEFKSSRFTSDRKKYSIRDLFDVSSKDYWTVDLSEILRIRNDNSWTDEEDEILRKHYPSMGKAVIDLLPNRPLRSIYKRANELGISFNDPYRFAQWEDDIIKSEYAKYGSDIYSKLNNRSRASVRQRAKVLKVYYAGENPILDEELQLMILRRSDGVSIQAIVEELNELQCNKERGVIRDLEYIKNVINAHKIYAKKAYDDEAMAIFMQYIHEPTRVHICNRLLGKSKIALWQKYSKSGVEAIPYTIYEMTYIRDNMDVLSLDDLVKNLNSNVNKPCVREAEGVSDHIRVIKGEFMYPMVWTDEECSLLTKYYPSKGMSYIKDILFYRSKYSIFSRVSEMNIGRDGIKKGERYDYGFCNELYREVDISSIKTVSKFCGRRADSIQNTIRGRKWDVKQFVDYILDNTYKGYERNTWITSLVDDGYPEDVIRKYSNNHTMKETIDYMLSKEYLNTTTFYKSLILKSPRAVALQLDISTSTWSKYKYSTGDVTLFGYAKYWYHHVIELGRFSNEEELDKFIRSNQVKFNIKAKGRSK